MDVMYAITGCVLAVILSCDAADDKGTPPRIELPAYNTWKPSVMYIRMNNPLTIPCIASGYPKPSYRWLYENSKTGKLQYVTNNDNIKFNAEQGAMVVSQAGVYACVASNKYGSSMTPLLSLVKAVTTAFPGVEVPPEGKRAYVSENITLECKNSADLVSKPKSQIVWKRGPHITKLSVLFPKDNIAVDPDGSLHFLWVKSEDFRLVYVCSSYNAELLMDYRNSHSFRLLTKPGEVTSRNPSLLYADDVTAVAGTNATLTCLFSYYSTNGEQLKITWRHRNKVVGEGQTLVLPLAIPTDQTDMSGNYTCEATLDTFKTMANVKLTITSPPVFIPGQEMTYLTVVRGNDAVFRCGTRSYGTKQGAPMWFKDTRTLDENNDRFLLSADRTMLTLPGVKLSDQLCVQCRVNNKYGSAFGAGCLTVINKIKVLHRPSNRYEILPGTPVNVRVNVTTDERYEDKLKYEWVLYTSTQSEAFVKLPLAPCFRVHSSGKQLIIDIPGAKEGNSPWAECSKHLSMTSEISIGVNISHPYDFKHFKFDVYFKKKDTDDDGSDDDDDNDGGEIPVPPESESSVTAGGMKAVMMSWFTLLVASAVIMLQWLQ